MRLLSLAERIEADAVSSLAGAATPAIAASCGLLLRVKRGLVGTFAASADVLELNRVLGFCSIALPNASDIREWLVVAERAGVPRLLVQVPPIPEADDIAAMLEAEGARAYSRWVRLARRTADPLPDSPDSTATPYAIEPIAAADHARALGFARVIRTSFGMPPVVEPWLAAAVGRPGWRHYVALAGDDVIATGALYVVCDRAWMGLASTREDARGHGAQSALVARRVAEARAAGAEWIFAETAEETTEYHATSYHNLRRLGFEELYRRTNYLFDFGAA
jgi:ribosomal protein S18 acetylase RimI-like enzyme